MSVSLIFSGDVKDVEKAFQKLAREHQQLKDDLRKISQVSRQASKDQESALQTHLGSVTQWAGGLIGVAAAGAQVVDIYREWNSEQKHLTEQTRKLNTEIIKSIAASGDLAQGQRIRQSLENVPGATPEEAFAAFQKIRERNTGADLGRVLDITKEVAPLSQAFPPDQLGTLVGELADLMPKKESGDLVDFATTVIAQAGDDADKLVEDSFLRSVKILEQAGLSVEEGFGLGLAALEAHLSPKIIEQMAALVEAPPDVPHGKEARTPEGQAKAKFAAMSKEQRLQALLNDETMRRALLPGVKANQMGILSANTATEGAKALKDAMAADSRFNVQKQIEEQFPAAAAERRREVELRRLDQLRAPAARERANAAEQMELELQQGGVPKWLAGKAGGSFGNTLSFAGWLTEFFTGGPSEKPAKPGESNLSALERGLIKIAGLTEEQNRLLRAQANRPLVANQHGE